MIQATDSLLEPQSRLLRRQPKLLQTMPLFMFLLTGNIWEIYNSHEIIYFQSIKVSLWPNIKKNFIAVIYEHL
jgi:hypothetical protein